MINTEINSNAAGLKEGCTQLMGSFDSLHYSCRLSPVLSFAPQESVAGHTNPIMHLVVDVEGTTAHNVANRARIHAHIQTTVCLPCWMSLAMEQRRKTSLWISSLLPQIMETESSQDGNIKLNIKSRIRGIRGKENRRRVNVTPQNKF